MSGHSNDPANVTAQYNSSTAVVPSNPNTAKAHSTTPISFFAVPSKLDADPLTDHKTWNKGDYDEWEGPLVTCTDECLQTANLARHAYRRSGGTDQESLLAAIQAQINTVGSGHGFGAIAVDASVFDREWQRFESLVDRSAKSAKPFVGFLAMSVEKKEPTEVSRWEPNQGPNSGYSKVNTNKKPVVWYRIYVHPTDDVEREEAKTRISYMATRLDTLSNCRIPSERVKSKVLKEFPDCQIAEFSRGFLGLPIFEPLKSVQSYHD